MKKQLKFFLLVCTGLLGCTVSFAQTYYYQYQTQISTAGYTFDANVNDMSYDASTSKLVVTTSSINSSTGDVNPVTMRYDPNSGLVMAGWRLNITGYGTVRTYITGGYQYILGTYNYGVGLIKVNTTSGAIAFSKYWKYGNTPNRLTPTDMDYDGSGNFYIVGNFDDGSQTDMFIMKVSTAGVLVSMNQVGFPTINEGAFNVQYYSATEMYIGGYYGTVGSDYSNGWLVVYNPTANACVTSTVGFYPASGWNRLGHFCAKRLGSYIYTVGSSILALDGAPGILYVGKFDLIRTPLAHSTYTAGAFQWQNEFNFSNNQIIVTGQFSNQFSGVPSGYSNMIFDLFAGFVDGQDYPCNTIYNNAASHTGATTSTSVYTCGMAYDINTDTYNMQRVRVPGIDVTIPTCPYEVIVPPLGDEQEIVNPKPVPAAMSVSEIALSTTASALAFTNTTICLYNSGAQRLASADDSPLTNNALQLYPNPASDVLHISTNENTVMNELDILDLAGRVIYHSEQPMMTAEIPLSDYSDGVYFVRVLLDNGHTEIQKFVRQ